MDHDTLKAALPLAGGMLAFLGALLTYFNSRLKDAETEAGRQAVRRKWFQAAPVVLAALAIPSAVAGIAVLAYVAAGLICAAYALALWDFGHRRHPMYREEIAVLCLI